LRDFLNGLLQLLGNDNIENFSCGDRCIWDAGSRSSSIDDKSNNGSRDRSRGTKNYPSGKSFCRGLRLILILVVELFCIFRVAVI